MGQISVGANTPEFIANLPDNVAALPSAVGRLADGAASYAGRLWNDPLGTAARTLASGVDGLRTGFNRVVNGDGTAMGSASFAIGTAFVPLGRFGNVADGALPRMNPRDIRFTQDTVSPNWSDGGTISDTINQLRAGQISADAFPPIRAVNYDGNVWSLDNRRLTVFSAAQVDDIPVQMLDLSTPAVSREFWKKFNPIDNGQSVVVVPRSGQAAARSVLRQNGMYGPN